MAREIFGPVLHVASFEGDEIEDVVASINGRGYGLTFGLHTRIDRRVQEVLDLVHVGNVYVNRDQIGAVVGSQPFGGHGLSGTGPKAGGPNYLPKFRLVDTPVVAPGDARQSVSLDAARAAFESIETVDASGHAARIAQLRGLLRGRAAAAMAAAAALDMGPIDMAGPTGEANQLELLPRGRVLCMGPGAEALLSQVVQALAAGNSVLAVAPEARKALGALRKHGLSLHVLDGSLDPRALMNLEFDLLAYSGDAALVRPVLAARSGPIVPLVSTVIAPEAHCLERAICVDTTAAGGNASLLAEAEP